MRARRRRHLINLVILALAIAVIVGYFGFYDSVWNRINKGLDLVGGIHVVLEARPTDDTPVTEEAMISAMEIIRRRVDAMGVAEPMIYREGERRIVVALPGVGDPEMALEMIGRTARLEFTDEEGNVLITGAYLNRAQAMIQTDERGVRRPIVQLEFDAEGREIFADATREQVGNKMIIMLDDEEIQAPVVRSVISSGEPIIEGYESLEEAQRVSVLLNSGALPLNLEPLRPNFVSATL
ncbi:MAG: preprotein translocase subunit SecD, partial [Clostridia bacterium]